MVLMLINQGRSYGLFRRARAGTHRPSPPAKANPLPTPSPSLILLPYTSFWTPKESGIGRRDTPPGCAGGGQGPLRNDLRPPIRVFSHLLLMPEASRPSRSPLPSKAYLRHWPELRESQLPTPRPSITRAKCMGEGVSLPKCSSCLPRDSLFLIFSFVFWFCPTFLCFV